MKAEQFKDVLSKLQELVTVDNISAQDLSVHLSNILDEKSIKGFLYQLRKNGYSPSRGVYNIHSALPIIDKPKSVKEKGMQSNVSESTESIAFQTIKRTFKNTTDMSYLIPKIDPNYIKFGNYSIIEKVLSTNKFAPVWITGLSGNGKTYSVEQACANLNRKMVLINITNETTEEDLIGSFSLETTNSYEIECDEQLYAEFLASQ